MNSPFWGSVIAGGEEGSCSHKAGASGPGYVRPRGYGLVCGLVSSNKDTGTETAMPVTTRCPDPTITVRVGVSLVETSVVPYCDLGVALHKSLQRLREFVKALWKVRHVRWNMETPDIWGTLDERPVCFLVETHWVYTSNKGTDTEKGTTPTISKDGCNLATFIPSHRGFPDDAVLSIISLQKDSLGDILYAKSFEKAKGLRISTPAGLGNCRETAIAPVTIPARRARCFIPVAKFCNIRYRSSETVVQFR
ncbi:mitophagy [Branchiostoma belcheri]|nr:mitophagy [Branchiostoma belcheri]